MAHAPSPKPGNGQRNETARAAPVICDPRFWAGTVILTGLVLLVLQLGAEAWFNARQLTELLNRQQFTDARLLHFSSSYIGLWILLIGAVLMIFAQLSANWSSRPPNDHAAP
jgi:uncharacterized membrane protein